MKTIEITCKNNGSSITVIKDNDKIKYVQQKEIINEIINVSKSKILTKIIDGNIHFRDNHTRIIIKNYRNNKDLKLEKIIENIKKINEQEKRNKLRNKKIKRVKALTGIAIISIGLILNTTLINIKENTETKSNVVIVNVEEENNVETPENIIEEPVKEQGITIELEVDSRVDSDKFINTKTNYYEKITKYSNDYGIDPRIMLAIATQESGEHSNKTNGYAIGLMQIEKSVWLNKDITAYNFIEGRYEKVKVTEEKLKDVDFNIKFACMYMQKCLKDSKYDLNVAIQMYNFGYGNIEKTFRFYHQNGNLDLNTSLKDYDNNWLNYRNYINVGDSEYLEHVVSYIEDLERITCKNETGEDILYTYKINEYKPKI